MSFQSVMEVVCDSTALCHPEVMELLSRGQVAVECKMAVDIEDYATSFRPDIIDAVSAWCQGATFAKVLTLTDVFEVTL